MCAQPGEGPKESPWKAASSTHGGELKGRRQVRNALAFTGVLPGVLGLLPDYSPPTPVYQLQHSLGNLSTMQP